LFPRQLAYILRIARGHAADGTGLIDATGPLARLPRNPSDGWAD